MNDNSNQQKYEQDYEVITKGNIKPKKVWSPVALKVICILFSYLSVFIFFMVNYSIINHPQKRSRIRYLIITTVVYLLLAVVLPQTLYVSPVFILINIIIGVYTCNDQRSYYTNYIEAGGKKHSTIVLVLLSVLTFLLVMVLIGSVMNLFESTIERFK